MVGFREGHYDETAPPQVSVLGHFGNPATAFPSSQIIAGRFSS